MKRKILLIVFFSAILSLQNVYAQYCMNPTGSQIFYTNSGNFFDSGCNTADYSNNENGTITFCPTSSCLISLRFTSIILSDAGDVLTIYSGSASGPILATFQGSLISTSVIIVTSTDTSGCLTARFVSNGFAPGVGWGALIQCLPNGITETENNNSVISIAPDLSGNLSLSLLTFPPHHPSPSTFFLPMEK